MAFDAYSPCPGGTGKKIKFCCPDLIPDHERIQRMLEGDQQVACLKLIEELEKKHPDRACLLAIKAMLQRIGGQTEAYKETVADFRRKHPNNPLALAEAAMLAAATQGGEAALDPMHRALAAANGRIAERVYEAMGAVVHALIFEGLIVPAQALLQLMLLADPRDADAAQKLLMLHRAAAFPLLVREEPSVQPCPDDAPWADEFQQAVEPLREGVWLPAVERLQALADKVPDSPAVWNDLALFRGWIGDRPGSVAAWRRYAELDVPLEDAVEALARAQLLSDDPLGDWIDVVSFSYPVADPDHLQACLTTAAQVRPLPVPPRASDVEGPPPAAAYAVLDRPLAKDGAAPAETAAVVAQALLYGKETDRAARLEMLGALECDRETVHAALAGAAGDALGPATEPEVVGKTSRTFALVTRRWWIEKNDVSGDELRDLDGQAFRRAALEEWPEFPLGMLDGKTPREVAGDEGYCVKLLAAVMVVESWTDQERGPDLLDFNELRRRLDLATLEAIDPDSADVNQLPLVRLARVEVDKLSDDALAAGFQRAWAFRTVAATRRFARELVQRPSFADRDELPVALVSLTRMELDPEKAIEYINRGRELAERQGKSSASWDLQELALRITHGHGEQIMALIDHIQHKHIREPGVADALMSMLVRSGLVRPGAAPAEAPGEQESDLLVPGQPGAEPGKLWTPEGTQPAGEKPKIWTPD